MQRLARGVSVIAMTVALAGGASIGYVTAAAAQAALDLTAVNNVPGLSAADQTGLDAALNAVNTAEQSGTQDQINAALAQLATAMQTAAKDDPGQAAALAGAATAAVPQAALTITQNAAAGDPTDAASIAVAVYNNLPSDLQTNANKTLIANSTATGAGINSSVITTALGTLATTNLTTTSTLPPAPPLTPPPTSQT